MNEEGRRTEGLAPEESSEELTDAYWQVVEAVRRHTPVGDRAEAEKVVAAVLESLGDALLNGDRRAVVRLLPDRVAELLGRGRRGGAGDLDVLYTRVSERLAVGREVAVEHTRAALQGLGRALHEGRLEALRSRLPPEMAALIDDVPESRSRSPSRPPRAGRTAGAEGLDQGGRTLSSGRPGSSRPISEAAPGHRDSIAVNKDPRSRRKIASSDGTPGSGESLSSGRQGSRHPLSEAGEE